MKNKFQILEILLFNIRIISTYQQSQNQCGGEFCQSGCCINQICYQDNAYCNAQVNNACVESQCKYQCCKTTLMCGSQQDCDNQESQVLIIIGIILSTIIGLFCICYCLLYLYGYYYKNKRQVAPMRQQSQQSIGNNEHIDTSINQLDNSQSQGPFRLRGANQELIYQQNNLSEQSFLYRRSNTRQNDTNISINQNQIIKPTHVLPPINTVIINEYNNTQDQEVDTDHAELNKKQNTSGNLTKQKRIQQLKKDLTMKKSAQSSKKGGNPLLKSLSERKLIKKLNSFELDISVTTDTSHANQEIMNQQQQSHKDISTNQNYGNKIIDTLQHSQQNKQSKTKEEENEQQHQQQQQIENEFSGSFGDRSFRNNQQYIDIGSRLEMETAQEPNNNQLQDFAIPTFAPNSPNYQFTSSNDNEEQKTHVPQFFQQSQQDEDPNKLIIIQKQQMIQLDGCSPSPNKPNEDIIATEIESKQTQELQIIDLNTFQ